MVDQFSSSSDPLASSQNSMQGDSLDSEIACHLEGNYNSIHQSCYISLILKYVTNKCTPELELLREHSIHECQPQYQVPVGIFFKPIHFKW